MFIYKGFMVEAPEISGKVKYVGRYAFTAATGVQIPLGTPAINKGFRAFPGTPFSFGEVTPTSTPTVSGLQTRPAPAGARPTLPGYPPPYPLPARDSPPHAGDVRDPGEGRGK